MIKFFTILMVLMTTLFTFLTGKRTSNTNIQKKHFKNSVDTSRVFYYSFSKEKVVDLKEISKKPLNEKLIVRSGAKVVLEAPIFYANALYLWEGPAGFRSYSPNVQFDKVEESDSGIYTISVKKGNGFVAGKIELLVLNN